MKSLLLVFLISMISGKRVKDKVESLPLQSNINLKSDWYSGYYNVSTSRHLHYIYIESMNKPETDPVLVFFNGGPGGSSIINIFFGLGPVYSDRGSGELQDWAYSWCNNASVMFIDNPAGVGYSYAGRKVDWHHSDNSY
jgi:carboxypeptidase C (cathepsin A)